MMDRFLALVNNRRKIVRIRKLPGFGMQVPKRSEVRLPQIPERGRYECGSCFVLHLGGHLATYKSTMGGNGAHRQLHPARGAYVPDRTSVRAGAYGTNQVLRRPMG